MRPFLAALFAVAAGVTASPSSRAGAPVYTILHTFTDARDGQPISGLIAGASGVLYGVTFSSVYRLLPPGAGNTAWRYEVIHRFDPAIAFPERATLAIDPGGALYGTIGEDSDAALHFAYKVAPPSAPGQGWRYQIIAQFQIPLFSRGLTGLALDSAGRVYGATGQGGRNQLGSVFQLTPPKSPATRWTTTVLHDFGNDRNDGFFPEYAPTGVAANGRVTLFGTTYAGGTYSNDGGTVFRLVSPGQGQPHWSYSVLHSFDGSHISAPTGRLRVEPDGTLLGVDGDLGRLGGGGGDAFALSPPAPGRTGWTETTLHEFTAGVDGYIPRGAFAESGSGTLYGIVGYGSYLDGGAVYALLPRSGIGPRTLNVIYPFSPQRNGMASDDLLAGAAPGGQLALYGTTATDSLSAPPYGQCFRITFGN